MPATTDQPVKKYLPIPNGCKRYWFNAAGSFRDSDGSLPVDENLIWGRPCLFVCIASNEKKAKEKWYEAVETAFQLAAAVVRNNPKRS